MTQSSILFEEKNTSSNSKIAIATLNSTKSLNALSLSMITLLYNQLTIWLADPNIAVIVLEGAGDKAFCAGGDVVSIYQDIVEKRHLLQTNASLPVSDENVQQLLGVEFFTKEYQLDLLIHQAKKPILVWADGYVMGGGIGLLAGASHRIVTEKTMMAMPEVTIGLYPDVGASWFLNQMSSGVGLFLGLTGMTFTGQDAIFVGLADYIVKSEDKAKMLEQLLSLDWQGDDNANQQLLSEVITVFKRKDERFHHSVLEEQAELINKITLGDDLNEIYSAIVNEKSDSEWFNKAQKKIVHGSPLSLHLIFNQLLTCKQLSLVECFKKELNLSLRCCQHTEFPEGVRALLVDKDKQPHWKYTHVKQVEKKEIDWFFTPVSY
ncbi:enoyl-CoA hydratase/isomerase family protein [Thalassotalea piscium]